MLVGARDVDEPRPGSLGDHDGLVRGGMVDILVADPLAHGGIRIEIDVGSGDYVADVSRASGPNRVDLAVGVDHQDTRAEVQGIAME